jgi:hypothetical protein
MELVLNLIWLALAIPAAWLWRRQIQGQDKNLVGTAAFVVVVSCVLLLLFPIVSASDDLRAMRSEIEESCPGKRLVKQAVSHRTHLPEFSYSDLQFLGSIAASNPQIDVSGRVHTTILGDSYPTPSVCRSGRSPPRPELS